MHFYKIIMACFILYSSSSIADHNIQPEEHLYGYGIAYCLSYAEAYKPEAVVAQGGYFQNSNHSIFHQKQIEHFIDDQLALKLDSYQLSNQPAYLMRCLDISYSEEYRAYVRHTLDKSSYE